MRFPPAFGPAATAAGTTGSDTVVGLVVADAGAAETTRNPHIDATPSHTVKRERRIPPPYIRLFRLGEVYGRSALLLRCSGVS
jgi:hypothetical protein